MKKYLSIIFKALTFIFPTPGLSPPKSNNQIFHQINFSLMVKVFLLTLSLILNVSAISQSKKESIGVSIPVIWNNSEAIYYSLGSPDHLSGNAISYGFNINYTRVIYKSLFMVGGIGYFKQKFGIKRPFNYVTPDSTKPIVYTEYYWYRNIYWLLGIGYQKMLSKNLSFMGTISYNNYHSYEQRYAQKYFPGVNEIYKKRISIGEMVNLDLGINQYISNKVSVGGNIILPVFTHWNKDEIFFNNYYSNDEQQIAHNKFSLGIAISCSYHF